MTGAALRAVPTIQAAATAGILESTRLGGGDVDWVVRDAGLTLEQLSRPERRLPLKKFVRLIEAASQSTGDDCFGAHVGLTCGVRELGLPGYLANFAPTVELALDGFARYYYLLGDATDVRFEQHADRASFTYCVLDPESWPRRQDAEQVLTMIVVMLRAWIGPEWRPEWIGFEHARPRHVAELERLLRCPLRFECDTNSLCFDRRDAQAANPGADARLFQLLGWFADSVLGERPRDAGAGSFRECVLGSIDVCANLGHATVHSVSRELGLEPRSLQRRLQADDTSFSALLEEYRQRKAARLLDGSRLSEKEIASRLGYGSLNSFIRAFRRWHGQTPGQFRAAKADPR